MSIEDKVSQATNRMTEFYNTEYLSDYVKYCHHNKIPYNESMLFLDGQTRADYYVTQQVPKIWEYMERVDQWYNSEDR